MNKTFPLIVLFLLGASCTKVELPNGDDYGIYIKNPIFRQWCYDHLDVNRDGKISSAETEAVRDIRVDYDKVTSTKMTSLIGIERFKNLEYLDIYSYVKDLSCLKANNKLKYVRIRGGVLEKIYIPESLVEIGDYSFVKHHP